MIRRHLLLLSLHLLSVSLFGEGIDYRESYLTVLRANYAGNSKAQMEIIAVRDAVKAARLGATETWNEPTYDRFNYGREAADGSRRGMIDNFRAYGEDGISRDIQEFRRQYAKHVESSPGGPDPMDLVNLMMSYKNPAGGLGALGRKLYDLHEHEKNRGEFNKDFSTILSYEADDAAAELYSLLEMGPFYVKGNQGPNWGKSMEVNPAVVVNRELRDYVQPFGLNALHSPAYQSKQALAAQDKLFEDTKKKVAEANTPKAESSKTPAKSGETSHGETSPSGRPVADGKDSKEGPFEVDWEQVEKEYDKAKSPEAKNKILGSALLKHQANTAAKASKMVDQQEALDYIRATQNAMGGIIQIVGITNPRLAQSLSIASNFAAGMAVGLVSFAANPVLGSLEMVGVVGNLIGQLNQGESDTEVILKQIVELKELLEQFRQEVMGRLNSMEDNLTFLVRTTFNSVQTQLTDLQNELQKFSEESRERDRQIMTGIDNVLRNQDDWEDESRRALRKQRYQEFIDQLSDLTPDRHGNIPDHLKREQVSGMNRLWNLGRQRAHVPNFSPLNGDVESQRKLYQDLRTELSRGDGYGNLPAIHEAYRQLGIPLTSQESLADPRLWRISTHALSRMASLPDPAIRQKFQQWDRGTGPKRAEPKFAELLQEGKHFTDALTKLRDPKVVGAVVDHYIDNLFQISDLANDEYAAASSINGTKFDLFKGPAQGAHSLPKFKDYEKGGGDTIRICSPDLKGKLDKVTGGLGSIEVPLTADLRKAIAESVPEFQRTADELGVGQLTICIKDVSMADRKTPKYTYDTYEGEHYEYTRFQWNKFKVTFAVSFGGKELNTVSVTSDPIAHEFRTARLPYKKVGCSIFPASSPKKARMPTVAEFNSGAYRISCPELNPFRVPSRLTNGKGKGFNWNEARNNGKVSAPKLDHESKVNPYWDYAPRSGDFTRAKDLNIVGNRLKAEMAKKKTIPVNSTTFNNALTPLRAKAPDAQLDDALIAARATLADEIDSRYRNIFFSAGYFKMIDDGKNGLKAENKTEKEMRQDVEKSVKPFLESLDKRLLEEAKITDEKARGALVAEIKKHFDAVLDPKAFGTYLAIDRRLEIARMEADHQIADKTGETKYREALKSVDGLKTLIDRSLALGLGKEVTSPTSLKFNNRENGAIETPEALEELGLTEISDSKTHNEIMSLFLDTNQFKVRSKFGPYSTFIRPDGSGFLPEMHRKALEAKSKIQKLLEERQKLDATPQGSALKPKFFDVR